MEQERFQEFERNEKSVQQKIIDNIELMKKSAYDHHSLSVSNKTQLDAVKDQLVKFSGDVADLIKENQEYRADIKRMKEDWDKEKVILSSNAANDLNPDYDAENTKEIWLDHLRELSHKRLKGDDKASFKFSNESVKNDCARFLASSKHFKSSSIKDIKLSYLEGVLPDGGFFILPEYFDPRVTRMYETSPMRQLSSVRSITGTNQARIICTDNLMENGGWVGEVSPRPVTDTNKYYRVDINLNQLYANPDMSYIFQEDAPFDAVLQASQRAIQTMALLENSAFMVGDGNGKPQGILSYPIWQDTLTEYGNPQNYQRDAFEYIYSGADGTFNDYAALIRLKASLPEPYQPNAVFMTTRVGLSEIMQLTDTQGRPIYQQMNLLRDGYEAVLLGRPVYITSSSNSTILNPQLQNAGMPEPTSAGKCILYGDFFNTYQIIDSPQVHTIYDPYTNKPFVSLYVGRRVGARAFSFEGIKGMVLSAAPTQGQSLRVNQAYSDGMVGLDVDKKKINKKRDQQQHEIADKKMKR